MGSFRDVHPGGTIIVCGCGMSLTALDRPERFVTIGVNDVGRLFDPTYLVVVDGREHLGGERFGYVEGSRSEYVFTQRTTLRLARPGVVHFRLGKPGRPETHVDILPHSRAGLMTPHVAMCLALHMGARLIGLIGVDLTDGHFFGPTGAHEWSKHLARADAAFAALARVAAGQGGWIVNLGAGSRLSSLPKLSVDAFARLIPTVTKNDPSSQSHIARAKPAKCRSGVQPTG